MSDHEIQKERNGWVSSDTSDCFGEMLMEAHRHGVGIELLCMLNDTKRK